MSENKEKQALDEINEDVKNEDEKIASKPQDKSTEARLEESEDEKIASKPQDKSTEAKLEESEDKLLRSLAEIENQRRRFEKEIKDAFEFGSFNFAKESLVILDNLQRAKLAIKSDESLKDNKDLGKFIENITIIEKDLITIFEKNRIKKIDTKNKKFDPNVHQAMSEIEDENAETGSILEEVQAGYMLSDRLLRPALVAVAKKKDHKTEENEKKK